MGFKRLQAETVMYFQVFVLLFALGSTKVVSDQAKEFKARISGDESTPTDPPWMSRPGMPKNPFPIRFKIIPNSSMCIAKIHYCQTFF